MSLAQQIQEHLVAAMKAQDKVKTGALRMLKSAVKNAEIENKGVIDDALCIKVINKLCKQRKESIEVFEANDRAEMAAAEKAELAILEAYLPKALGDDEIDAAVSAVLAELNITDPKKMGQVVGAVMKKLAGQAVDGKRVQDRVKLLMPAS